MEEFNVCFCPDNADPRVARLSSFLLSVQYN